MTVSRGRRVLVLTHFFPPEPCAAANRAAALAAALVRAGFDVEVVTGIASFPSGRIARGTGLAFPRTSIEGGVRVTRVPTFASPVQSGRNRIANWLSVALGMTAYAATMRRRADVVFATMPPITLALPALVAKLRHRAKLVVDVRDVFPDVAIRMGYWAPGGAAAKLVGAIARASYRAADLVLCVTASAEREIRERGCPAPRLALAPNGFDPLRVGEMPAFGRQDGDFVATFVGNMGLATGLDTVLDAAAIVRSEHGIRFVLAGDGADRARLEARKAAEDLANVAFTGALARDAANALVAASDVAVVPLHPGLTDSLPTKLFDAMALGRPVVCCANGEARAFVERSGGGLVVEPGNGPALAAALRSLRDDAALRGTFADRGRRYVLTNFDRERVMDGVARRIEALSSRPVAERGRVDRAVG